MTKGYNQEEKYFKKKDAELLEALIRQTVWVLSWKTESGDRGIEGAWFHKPREMEQLAFMKEKFPDEFDAVADSGEPMINWECLEFTISERM